MAEELPEITTAVLDQWEQSARDDLAAGKVWSVHPAAILSAVKEIRDLRREVRLRERQT